MKLDLIEDMFEKQVRAENLIHLGTMSLQDAWSSETQMIFSENIDSLAELLDLPLEEDMACTEMAELLNDADRLGWLVKFSTPIPRHIDRDNQSYNLCWSQYTSKWFYGEDYEALCEEALAWREQVVRHYLKAPEELS